MKLHLFLLLGIFTVGAKAAVKRAAPGQDVANAVQEVINEADYAIEEALVYPPSLPLNVLLKGSAAQSSTHTDWLAEKAIDGVKDDPSRCSSTGFSSGPFWRLDLMEIFRVHSVVVTNRIDCCEEHISGAEIRVGNSLEDSGNHNPICAVIPSIPLGRSVSFSCSGMAGRYVNVIIPGEYKELTLCEVEVYGTELELGRSLIKIKLESGADLTDPETRDKLLEELETALKIEDVNLNWIQAPVETGTEDAGQEQCL